MGDKSDISGFILAGGKSRRMGTDKALLTIENEPLLKRMIRLIEPFCNPIVISGENADYSVFNVQMIPDLYSGRGPIAGIHSSLNHSFSEWNFLVSVDVPFVNEELIQSLISEKGEYDCIIPGHTSGIEPLIGLYHKRILPVVIEMIENGDYKLMNLISRLNVRFVNCNSLIQKYPRLFININRPEDFQLI